MRVTHPSTCLQRWAGLVSVLALIGCGGGAATGSSTSRERGHPATMFEGAGAAGGNAACAGEGSPEPCDSPGEACARDADCAPDAICIASGCLALDVDDSEVVICGRDDDCQLDEVCINQICEAS